MAIRAELSADKDRGPGYGLLRIAGLGTPGGSVDFSIKSTQVTAPFLGSAGRWQATEAWHSVTTMTAEGDDLLIPVGPEIVDAIVAQPMSGVGYFLTVATGVRKQGTTLTVHRLLGSGAGFDDQAERERLQREQEERERQEHEAERLRREQEEAERARQAEAERLRREQEDATVLAAQRQAAEPVVPVMGAEPPRRRWLLALIPALIVLSAAGVAGSWYACLIPIPGLVPERCTETRVVEPVPVVPPVPAASATSCAGLSVDDCVRLAETALSEKRLEPARQLFQQGAQMGSAKAAVALARMYDPETWAAAASPVAAADWETAVYWYETAARSGDGAGLLGAGRLLCREAKSDIERRQGLKYLREAEAKGAGEAKALIQACEARGS
ncbi:MAG: hypothetical protein WAS73_08810 [Defluviicoccus sp.]